MCLLHHIVCVNGPFKVVSDVHADQLEAFDPLLCGPIDVDGGVLSLRSPVVHDQLLRFVDFEGELIFLAPGIHLLPVGCLVIVGNQAYLPVTVSE